MLYPLLLREYVAVVLIKVKCQIFDECFITISELNWFQNCLQQEFNNRGLGITITSNSLDEEAFYVVNGVVTSTDKCSYNPDELPSKILDILNDNEFIVNFFINMESKRLTVLEDWQLNSSVSKMYRK